MTIDPADVLILAAIASSDPPHAGEILRAVRRRGVFDVSARTLVRRLRVLVRHRLLVAAADPYRKHGGRPITLYRLTSGGRRLLRARAAVIVAFLAPFADAG